MPDVSDMELLRDYARLDSEDAFEELVRRHVNLVYSAAFRHVGIAAHAEEITQAVFVILSRKAAGLRPDTIIEAWLFETTRLTALSFLRGERRRQLREKEACMQSAFQESGDKPAWNQLAPLLDEAMARLGKKDREAVVLRFFKDKSLNEVAIALKTTEVAAQSRVHRAVKKLHKFFLKRGIYSTTAAISMAISANSIQAAPALLAKTTTAVALAKGATVSTSTLTLAKGALKIMAWTKAKTAIVAGVALLLTAGTCVTLQKLDRWEIISLKRINYDRSTPKGALFFMRRALVSGDSNGYADSFQLTDQDEALRSSLKLMVQSFAELHRVLAVKYGEASANVVIQNTAPGLMPKEMIDSGQVKADGGRMLMSFGGKNSPKSMAILELAQSNGAWQLSPESLFLGASKENITQTMTQCAVVIQKIIPEVQKGAYPNAGAVGLAIKHEMD